MSTKNRGGISSTNICVVRGAARGLTMITIIICQVILGHIKAYSTTGLTHCRQVEHTKECTWVIFGCVPTRVLTLCRVCAQGIVVCLFEQDRFITQYKGTQQDVCRFFKGCFVTCSFFIKVGVIWGRVGDMGTLLRTFFGGFGFIFQCCTQCYIGKRGPFVRFIIFVGSRFCTMA